MAPHKHLTKRRPRRARTPTPTTITRIKSQSTVDSKRQLLKSRSINKKRTVLAQKIQVMTSSFKRPDQAVRTRWMEIAKETERIVLGDGQYVEERYDLIAPCALAQRIEGFPMNPIGQAAESSTSAAVARDISLQIQKSVLGTTFYPHNSAALADWATSPQPTSPRARKTHLEFTRQSTLTAARRLAQHTPASSSRVGVLSTASRKRPGGGYLHGGDDQEERIARSSSLVASLSCPAAKEFYTEHRFYRTQDGSGFYDRSMVYSPGVVVFRAEPGDKGSPDPLGGSFISPYTVDVLSVVPVNAAIVRSVYSSATERLSDDAIYRSMKERMGRALRVFEEQGDKHVVLGAFGCSSSENKVDVVADIWAELLVCGDMEGEGGSKRSAPFKNNFDSVVFAVPGKHFTAFREAFERRLFEADLIDTLISD